VGGIEGLIANIERQIAAGVDWIQIREKDLTARDLLALARRAVHLAGHSPKQTRVLINSRMDVALAAGAHGVHLPSHSPRPDAFKRIAPHMLIGVSCHDGEQLTAAEAEGADYAVLGPVFPPLSKGVVPGPGLGLEPFTALVRTVQLPVIALGGITEANIIDCERAGAAGVAGITYFQQTA
jgi:thiamine-phosphate pyrophosphorylase